MLLVVHNIYGSCSRFSGNSFWKWLGDLMRIFLRGNFMEQLMKVSYSTEKIHLILYCQGQGLLAAEMVCFNCRRMMLFEWDRTSPDGWEWYAIITYNKLSTWNQDDSNLYNERYFIFLKSNWHKKQTNSASSLVCRNDKCV